MSVLDTKIDGAEATYVADTPGYGALFAGRRGLVGLAFDAEIHDVITADGAVVDDDIPSPEGNGIPLWIGQSAWRGKTATE